MWLTAAPPPPAEVPWGVGTIASSGSTSTRSAPDADVPEGERSAPDAPVEIKALPPQTPGVRSPHRAQSTKAPGAPPDVVHVLLPPWATVASLVALASE